MSDRDPSPPDVRQLLTGYPVSQAIHVAATLRIPDLPADGPRGADPETKFSDLHLLVAPGGQERTIDAWEGLFATTGFRLARAVPSAGGLNVIEAVPV